jgi:hypothetical protein
MPRPVTAIRNLGPAMAAAFARAGLESAEEIEALGAEAAYAALLGAGERPHFMAFLALALGLQGRPLGDIGPAEKPALRARFDAVVAAARTDGPLPGIEAELDRLGVGPRR